MFNLPVVVTDVSASQSFVVRVTELFTPLTTAQLTAWPTKAGLNLRLNTLRCLSILPAAQCLTFRRATVTDLDEALRANGFQGLDFDEGTNAGVGRISLGAKRLLYRENPFELALMGEFFAPSPSEAQFAGSNSAAILPRAVGSAMLTDVWRLHTDVGYDFDFDSNELRRFVWNVGASAALERVTLDFGFGGSKYNEGVTWTPDQAAIGNLERVQIGTIQIDDDNQLGDNFADFLGGIKVRLDPEVRTRRRRQRPHQRRRLSPGRNGYDSVRILSVMSSSLAQPSATRRSRRR